MKTKDTKSCNTKSRYTTYTWCMLCYTSNDPQGHNNNNDNNTPLQKHKSRKYSRPTSRENN